ncbi:hypothetical protein [Ramlibacter humi]|uniref:DUF2782 domain-containing protein n=1 Tax=Ramlibacter humi TaxID=2530451 RepID=A0A4Z0C9W7_9BURK|nr:hypothetical protein [Ramlibacter humi]TFZ07774.1 hypothetical protein EZ216_01010 [Ramlibacter humi]
MRLVFVALLLTALPAFAQQPPADDPAAPGRRNQRIEKLVHEDAGSRIEEIRYGGQMQSITVQPKAPVPSYEIAPSTPSRDRVTDERRGATGTGGGERYWNVLNF